jgi:hypothetical protein
MFPFHSRPCSFRRGPGPVDQVRYAGLRRRHLPVGLGRLAPWRSAPLAGISLRPFAFASLLCKLERAPCRPRVPHVSPCCCCRFHTFLGRDARKPSGAGAGQDRGRSTNDASAFPVLVPSARTGHLREVVVRSRPGTANTSGRATWQALSCSSFGAGDQAEVPCTTLDRRCSSLLFELRVAIAKRTCFKLCPSANTRPFQSRQKSQRTEDAPRTPDGGPSGGAGRAAERHYDARAYSVVEDNIVGDNSGGILLRDELGPTGLSSVSPSIRPMNSGVRNVGRPQRAGSQAHGF